VKRKILRGRKYFCQIMRCKCPNETKKVGTKVESGLKQSPEHRGIILKLCDDDKNPNQFCGTWKQSQGPGLYC